MLIISFIKITRHLAYSLLLLLLFNWSANQAAGDQRVVGDRQLTLAVVNSSPQEALPANFLPTLGKVGFQVQDPTLTQSVTQQLTVADNFNLHRDEARRLGQALGSELILLPRLLLIERATVGAKLYTDGYLALFFINSRSGELWEFALLTVQTSNAATALLALQQLWQERLALLAPQLQQRYQAQFQSETSEDDQALPLPAENAIWGTEFQPPQFTRRQSPQYPEIARNLAISATIELSVVLRKDRTIGKIAVLRWAGFGLEEAAIKAIRQLDFEPALLRGQPISCQAVIKYNFRYASLQSSPRH
jgi:TonB family protein